MSDDACCEDMQDDLARECPDHHRSECPDSFIHKGSRDYGLMVHDGGNSYVLINYCPWCGTKLRKSRPRALLPQNP